MGNLPSGTVTFLFTDIEGSTKLAQEYPEAWETALARHHVILQSAIEAHNGYTFKIIGDAFCSVFHTAGAALQAALKAQQYLHAEQWDETPVKIRSGIHTGKAELQDNGDYSRYLTLSRVQRLMSAGHGGQILISGATRELARDKIGDHRPPIEQNSVERDWGVIYSKLDDTEYSKLATEGSTMTTEQAIAVALEK